jgi:hypothetical protein
MSSTTFIFMTFSVEIIWCLKILFEAIIFWNSNFELFKWSHMKRLPKLEPSSLFMFLLLVLLLFLLVLALISGDQSTSMLLRRRRFIWKVASFILLWFSSTICKSMLYIAILFHVAISNHFSCLNFYEWC